MRRLTVLLFMTVFMLSGCNFTWGSADLLRPPRMTENQNSLIEALTDGVGSPDIRLKYPLRGDNQSSFINFNVIAGAPNNDTVVVFYSIMNADKSIGEGSLMMSVMSMRDSRWAVTDSIAAPDQNMSNVDFVKFLPMNDQGINNIAVGWSSLWGDSKKIVIYQFQRGRLTELFDYEYSEYVDADANGDGLYELFLITPASEMVLVGKQADFIELKAITALEPMSSFRQVRYGNLTSSLGAIFIDYYVNTSSGRILDTRIVTVDTSSLASDSLAEMVPEEWGFYGSFLRPEDSAVCEDINGNGVIDIPVLTPMPGFRGGDEAGAVYLTEYVSILEGGGFGTTLSSVINKKAGYRFDMPLLWMGAGDDPSVTVHDDGVYDEWSFYVYEGSSELSFSEAPLLRIRLASDQKDADELIAQGYQHLEGRGLFQYYVLIPDAADKSAASALRISYDDIKRCFRLL